LSLHNVHGAELADQSQRNKIVTDNIPTNTLYTLYLQHAKTLPETNYVQNHININNTLLYGILQTTVLFDTCAAFALEAIHNFQI